MEPSLRTQILKRFRQRWREGKTDAVNGGVIEKFAMELGFKPSNASRRLRELHEEGLLEREERPLQNSRVKSVWYKYRPTREETLSMTMQEKLYAHNSR